MRWWKCDYCGSGPCFLANTSGVPGDAPPPRCVWHGIAEWVECGPAPHEPKGQLVDRQLIDYLRSECEKNGDNGWEDDLHPVDIIEKHLLRHLLKPTPPPQAKPKKRDSMAWLIDELIEWQKCGEVMSLSAGQDTLDRWGFTFPTSKFNGIPVVLHEDPAMPWRPIYQADGRYMATCKPTLQVEDDPLPARECKACSGAGWTDRFSLYAACPICHGKGYVE